MKSKLPMGGFLVDEFSEVPGMNDVFVQGDGSLLKEYRYTKGHPQVAQATLAENLAANLVRV